MHYIIGGITVSLKIIKRNFQIVCVFSLDNHIALQKNREVNTVDVSRCFFCVTVLGHFMYSMYCVRH